MGTGLMPAQNSLDMKRLFMYLLLLLPLAIASCGGDDKDEPQDPNQGNTVATDVTATTSVKTATLGGITFYEDYNYRYNLNVVDGCVEVTHSIRINGEWLWYGREVNSGHNNYGIKDVGKVNSISEITSKDVTKGEGRWLDSSGWGCLYLGATFQPSHGYVVVFTTELNETKYLRIFTTKYTTASNGGLETVTVQYQLF